jgi:hypothetical protein
MFNVKAKNDNANIVTVYGVQENEHTHETEFLVFLWVDGDGQTLIGMSQY